MVFMNGKIAIDVKKNLYSMRARRQYLDKNCLQSELAWWHLRFHIIFLYIKSESFQKYHTLKSCLYNFIITSGKSYIIIFEELDARVIKAQRKK